MSDCIFCKIIKGEIPAKMIYKDEQLIAFHDINPKAPVHFLVVPVKHIESVRSVKQEDKELLGTLMLKIKEIAQKLGIDKNGYKILVNNGKDSGQAVFHLHFHVVGGWTENPQWKV